MIIIMVLLSCDTHNVLKPAMLHETQDEITDWIANKIQAECNSKRGSCYLQKTHVMQLVWKNNDKKFQPWNSYL